MFALSITQFSRQKIKKILLTLIILPSVLNAAFPVTAQYQRQKNRIHQSRITKKKVVSKQLIPQKNRPISLRENLNYSFESIEQRLVSFIQTMISTLKYTAYKLGGTHFDLRQGIYIVDCSSYVDHILRKIYPHAYSSLVSFSESQKPTTHDYFYFFTRLQKKSHSYWRNVEDVKQLRAGDILVFRYKHKRHSPTQGHIMIVMDKPIREKNIFKVKIADSAPHRHSHDTRQPHDSGIGIGTLLLKVNPKTFQPSAYAWRIGSQWKNNVNFAMARPFDITS